MIKRNPPQKLRRRRRRNHHPAVGAVYIAAPRIDPGGENLLDLQIFERQRHADNIDNRIHRADLVEMHFVRRPPVNLSLRLREARENRHRLFLCRVRQSRIRKQPPNLRHRPRRALFLCRAGRRLNLHIRRLNPVTAYGRNIQLKFRRGKKLFQFFFQIFLRRPRLKKRP